MRIPSKPPLLSQLFEELFVDDPVRHVEKIIQAQIGPTVDGRYRHWHKLQFLIPPEKFSHKEWWLAIKLARKPLLNVLPLADKQGKTFNYTVTPEAYEMLHRIDRDASGMIGAPEPVTNPNTRNAYLMRSLIEEAITSSQLEGATTTMKRAKQMIIQERKPRNRDEQMIFNNYNVMNFISQQKEVPLSTTFLFELHRILTDKTLEDPQAAGRFRTRDEEVAVRDDQEQILHTPPDANELPKRLEAMCQFINNQPSKRFIHPVIIAVLLHFWLAYDHPFVDGNGRTARALFYWCMLRQGYWLIEYLSISKILRKAPARYARAFLYTETDDNDTTYFILFQLHVLIRALDQLYGYLERKTKEIQDTERLISHSEELQNRLNHRQFAVINYAIKNPVTDFTIKGHKNRNNISYQTARTDLLELADESLNLLVMSRKGNEFVFRAPANLKARLETVAQNKDTV